jgi:hypothetical protein
LSATLGPSRRSIDGRLAASPGKWFKMNEPRSRNPVLPALSWRKTNRLFLATFVGLLAAVYIFILLVDPYGVVPFSLPFERPIMTTQRQMYPQILRTGRYDSIVVGTSTVRLLDPAALDRALGGHFASFAMPSSSAQEQVWMIDYFRRTVAGPKAVLVGLDHEWCHRTSGAADAREREFPFWAYDENPWNDFLYLLNSPTLEVAGRTIGRVLGLVPEKLRGDGFEVFVPPEATYDLARARYHIWGPGGARGPGPAAPVLELSEAEQHAMEFPALPWLDSSLAGLPETTRLILVFPPVHARAMPAPGSYGEAREAECKRRVAAIARRRGATLVDWRLVSPLTIDDSHFWDLLHYRLPIAYRLIDDLALAVNEGRESPDGTYRILVR